VSDDGVRPELSIVMPCLNEADTLGSCIAKAQGALRDAGISGEVIVADNGSSDDSAAIAERMGARVVHVSSRGYGSALMAGIAAANGTYVVMGDADDSYDFGEIPRFLSPLRAGYDLVQGCRLPSGGGTIVRGAMPALHRLWGNPMFSTLARRMFGAPVHDVYCGLRGFSKSFYDTLDLRCTGMEFATEMIIKSSLNRARIAEVPITLHPDGRRSHAPHLKTFRDGWNTLRLFLLSSPRWLFLVPGGVLIALGLLGYLLAMPGLRVMGANLDAHTLLFASLAILVGYNMLVFALVAKVFAVGAGLLPKDPRIGRLLQILTLERGIVGGGVTSIAGLVLLAVAFEQWRRTGFGDLDYPRTMREVIPGTLLVALGFQTVLSSFLLSLFELRRR
jgi:glycosyltransferase involved in cell wall biosynthesis